MNKYAEIAHALESHLASLAKANGYEIAWPNASFEPPEGAYLRCHLLPADTTSIDMQRTTEIHRGIFQVDVVTPAGTGITDSRRIIGEVCDLFANNTLLEPTGTQVLITDPPTVHPGIQDERAWQVPISISYYSQK